MAKTIAAQKHPARRASLKSLAEHLGLSPSTISYVLNDAPGRSIPEATRDRIRKAATEFNYQPSVVARTLQGKPMQTIGILLPELGSGYHAEVLGGVADLLMARGYFYFTVHHRHKAELVRAYPHLLRARGVDGILAIDTHLIQPPTIPTVLIAGQTDIGEITNVVLDHERAAWLALDHLCQLGHRKIVYMKGQTFSTDTELRWSATMRAASQLGLTVDESLIVELAIDSQSPEISYPGMSDVIGRNNDFTAVVCFNDVSAMGTIRALHDAGRQVPDQVSVLGFDDIESASFHLPSLSTIQQPLKQMGAAGAEALLEKLAHHDVPSIIRAEPKLIIRESTGRVRR